MENKSKAVAQANAQLVAGKTGMTDSEIKMGNDLSLKYPGVQEAAKQFVSGADAFGKATLTLVTVVRATPLNDRERALMLMVHGISKQRVSFLKRLWNMKDADYLALEEGKTSLKEAVAAERKKNPGKGGRKKKDKKEVSPVPEVKWKALPSNLIDAAAVLMGEAKQVNLLGGWVQTLRSDGHDIKVFVTRVKFESRKE